MARIYVKVKCKDEWDKLLNRSSTEFVSIFYDYIYDVKSQQSSELIIDTDKPDYGEDSYNIAWIDLFNYCAEISDILPDCLLIADNSPVYDEEKYYKEYEIECDGSIEMDPDIAATNVFYKIKNSDMYNSDFCKGFNMISMFKIDSNNIINFEKTDVTEFLKFYGINIDNDDSKILEEFCKIPKYF